MLIYKLFHIYFHPYHTNLVWNFSYYFEGTINYDKLLQQIVFINCLFRQYVATREFTNLKNYHTQYLNFNIIFL